MTQAKGEKENNKAARAVKHFAKSLQGFPGFSGKRKKRRVKGRKRIG
jgi:hypothetical protein